MLEDIDKDPRIGSTESGMSEHRQQLRKDVAAGTNLNYVQAAYGMSLDLPGLSSEMAQLMIQMPSIVASAAFSTGIGDAESGEELSLKPEATSGFEVTSVADGMPGFGDDGELFDIPMPGEGDSEYFADTTPSELNLPVSTQAAQTAEQPVAPPPVPAPGMGQSEYFADTTPSPSGGKPKSREPKRPMPRGASKDAIQPAGTAKGKPTTREALLKESGIDSSQAEEMLRAVGNAGIMPVKQSALMSAYGNLYPSSSPQEEAGTKVDFTDAVSQFSAASASEAETASKMIMENTRRIQAIERVLNEAAT